MCVFCNVATFRAGTSIAGPPPMVMINAPRPCFDVATTEATPLTVSDELLEAAPPTKRLNAGDLARVVSEMNRPTAEELETRPNTDDTPTVEAPAPAIPAGVPSPLGDDDAGTEAHDETLALGDLGLDLDDAFPFLPEVAEAIRSSDEADDSERRDALRAQRSVLASWAVSAAITAVVTLLATATPATHDTSTHAIAPLTSGAVAPRP